MSRKFKSLTPMSKVDFLTVSSIMIMIPKVNPKMMMLSKNIGGKRIITKVICSSHLNLRLISNTTRMTVIKHPIRI